MRELLLTSILFAISHGCAPSIPSDDPVITSTILSSTTALPTTTINSTITNTTITPISNTTTITIPTTTPTTTTTPPPPGCCQWPFPSFGINTVVPPKADFMCNTTLTVTCQLTDPRSGNYMEVSVVGNYEGAPPAALEGLKIVTATEIITQSFMCNTTLQRWYADGKPDTYSELTCGYKFSNNGTTVIQIQNST